MELVSLFVRESFLAAAVSRENDSNKNSQIFEALVASDNMLEPSVMHEKLVLIIVDASKKLAPALFVNSHE